MTPDDETIATFLNRLGHKVVISARKPIDKFGAPMTLWPDELDDPVDQISGLAREYHAVYCNLNPLKPGIGIPAIGVGLRDSMIAHRTRILIDVDGHDVPKEVAEQQKNEIKRVLATDEYGTASEPLIETDSGNGYGLIYETDLPVNEHSTAIVRNLLTKLKERFPCIDTSVSNAGRYTRVIGTLNKRDGARILTRILKC
jgi:hypothetical protein